MQGMNSKFVFIHSECKTSVTRSAPTNVVPAKSDSDVMFCLQSYQGPIIDILLVY